MLYFVCYDIASDRRRARVAKELLNFGVRVQESVFECDLASAGRLRELRKRLGRLVDASEDSVRLYRVCAGCAGEREIMGLDLGRPPLPSVLIL